MVTPLQNQNLTIGKEAMSHGSEWKILEKTGMFCLTPFYTLRWMV